MAWATIYSADVAPEFRPTYDNDKLGGRHEHIMAVAYVPGAETFTQKAGTLVTDCVGTCGAVDCSGCGRRGECYAIRVLCQYPSAARLRIANTLDLRRDVHEHFDKLRAYFATGRELPENMTVLVSIWYGLGLAEWDEFKAHPGVKAFSVGTPELTPDAHCPAYKKGADGKVRRVKSDAVKCGNCKLCTRARACKVIACEHHK